MEYNKICKSCKNEYTSASSKSCFCSSSCRNKYYDTSRKRQTYECAFCHKNIENRSRSSSKYNHFCSKECAINFKVQNSPIRKCRNCGSEFHSLHKNHTFCSDTCKGQYNKKNKLDNIHNHICDYCGKNFMSHKKSQKYCSRECFHKSCVKDSEKICEECSNSFKAKYLNQRFCSIECQNKWQRNNCGELSATYNHNIPREDRIKFCKICGKPFSDTPQRIVSRSFCSIACKRYWFANVWSQDQNNKLEASKRMVQILSQKKITKLDSRPQIIINELLENLKIDFINEYDVKYYAMDIYLVNSKLFIEVMGDYWHCNPIKYNVIKYPHQKARIVKDKAKHSYIKNKYHTEILYLWEHDIICNAELCKLLINEYINKNGMLKNYHSFNYEITSNNEIKLNSHRIKPYMDMNKKEISDLSLINNFSTVND